MLDAFFIWLLAFYLKHIVVQYVSTVHIDQHTYSTNKKEKNQKLLSIGIFTLISVLDLEV